MRTLRALGTGSMRMILIENSSLFKKPVNARRGYRARGLDETSLPKYSREKAESFRNSRKGIRHEKKKEAQHAHFSNNY